MCLQRDYLILFAYLLKIHALHLLVRGKGEAVSLGMYRIVNFTIRPEPDSEYAIRPEPEPDSMKVASQAQYPVVVVTS